MKLKSLKKIDQKLYDFFASKKFLYIILLIFGLMSAWVATASLYPMAFDEDFHMGVITIYSNQLSPLITATPEMARYGNVIVDPSYLFHYLMSFPYRFERDVLQLSETASIIGLRFINIGFFIAGLVIFWKALGLARVSVFARNIIIALVCLIPISPLLAGQVNYDNLMFIAVALSFLFAIRIINGLKANKKIPAMDAWWLFLVVLFGCAVKYAFLPIGAAVVLALILIVALSKNRKNVVKKFAIDSARFSYFTKLALLVLVGIGLILNVRYAVNLINYQDVSPDCDLIFSVEGCREYGPYGRSYNLRNSLDPNFKPKNVLAYTAEDWVPGMSFRLFFTVAGPTNDYDTQQPVIIPQTLYIIGMIAGIFLFLLYLIRAKRLSPTAWLFVITLGVYCLSLINQVYGGYKTSGIPVAVNGRYLIPLAPVIGGLIAVSITNAKLNTKKVVYKGLITTIVLAVLLLQGGGIGTYVVRGKSEWFWGGWGQSSHSYMQDVLEPITLK